MQNPFKYLLDQFRSNNNRKSGRGRNIQMVPIFKRDKNKNKIYHNGNPVILRYKKIVHFNMK